MNKLPLYTFFVFFLFGLLSFAQKHDSLSQKSYTYIKNKLDRYDFSNRHDSLAWVYLNAYLAKAKREKNDSILWKAYDEAIFYSDGLQKIPYADSMVLTAQKLNGKDYIGSAYLSKGIAYYTMKDHQKALDNYLKAFDYLQDSKDLYLKNKTLYNIASVKGYLGYYEEAVPLFEKVREHFWQWKDKDENSANYYLLSLHALGNIYHKTGEYRKAKETNLLGLSEAVKYNNRLEENYFHVSLGLDNYAEKNYSLAIQNINKGLPVIIQNGDFNWVGRANFYLGKSYLGLEDKPRALVHFKKLDSVFSRHGYLSPELREAFAILLDENKAKGDKDGQLHYIDQLLAFDKVNANHYQYLSEKVYKEYDTRLLEQDKKNIEDSLARMSVNFITIVVILCIFIFSGIGLGVYFNRKRLKEKKVFESFRKQQEAIKEKLPDDEDYPVVEESAALPEQVSSTAPEKDISVTVEKTEPPVKEDDVREERNEAGLVEGKKGLSEKTLSMMHAKIVKFEKQKGFIKHNTLGAVAEYIGSNTTYLSLYINQKKNMTFNQYINQVRVDYILDKLEKSPVWRNYPVRTLAEGSGFKNAQGFSLAFEEVTGLKPSVYISNLKKELEHG